VGEVLDARMMVVDKLVVGLDHMELQGFGLVEGVEGFRRILRHELYNHIFLQMHYRKFQKDMQELLKFQAYRYNILMNIHEHKLHQILMSNRILVVVVVVGVVDMKVGHMIEVVGMIVHMLGVVVVVVVVEVVVYRHMQK
jgi:hypothetical protein